jgi:transposase-like protein
LVEFAAWFPDDEACLDYMAWLRWGDLEFVCSLCGAVSHGWRRQDGRSYDCGACGRRTSVTAGTIFEKTRVPPTVWFRAAWELTTRPQGVSARNLQRALGLGSYQTAWMMLHRFRRAMVRPDREKLSGVVEVDECIIGGKNKTGKPGRSKDPNKIPVMVMTENTGKSLHGGTGKGIGRVRAVVLSDYSAEQFRAIFADNIEAGSVVISDAYSSMGPALPGYTHISQAAKGSPVRAHYLFPAVSRAQAQLKRWIHGTLQGSVSREHLQDYLSEFEFRFNRRHARKPGLLFYRLLEQSVCTDPVTYEQMKACTVPPRKTPTQAPTGPRSQPRSLDQKDAGGSAQSLVDT